MGTDECLPRAGRLGENGSDCSWYRISLWGDENVLNHGDRGTILRIHKTPLNCSKKKKANILNIKAKSQFLSLLYSGLSVVPISL